jgi:hypothetical protein
MPADLPLKLQNSLLSFMPEKLLQGMINQRSSCGNAGYCLTLGYQVIV